MCREFCDAYSYYFLDRNGQRKPMSYRRPENEFPDLIVPKLPTGIAEDQIRNYFRLYRIGKFFVSHISYRVMGLYRLSKTCYFEFFVVSFHLFAIIFTVLRSK